MNELERFKEQVLKEYPRLGENDTFQFKCHSRLECFNQCCSDVNIFLTPYDVLRMKKSLGISSEELLAKYTFLPVDKNQQYPVVMLKLNDENNKFCYFVDDEKGCTIYPDRPWACRMYPLGMASPSDEDPAMKGNEFYFLLKEDICKGHGEDNSYTIKEWLADQGINKYDEFGKLYKEITLHKYFLNGWQLPPEKMDMFFMVCYNSDKFRKFLFETSFLDRFDVPEVRINQMKTDDEELLKFGFEWLRFALFGEKTMKVKPGAELVKK